MDWRLKALAFWTFQLAPGGDRLHYWMQRHITKTLPRPAYSLDLIRLHIRAFADHPKSMGDCVYFEFGVGRDLFANLALYCYGMKRQLVVDLNPLAKPELINAAIAYLRDYPPLDALRLPERPVGRGFVEELNEFYGIDYRAPADARALDVPAGSVDLIGSINTMEHIPPESLREILIECYRISNEDSIISFRIDYGDHYYRGDPKINSYNFLRFSEVSWRLFNPSMHYQNRLRHRDFVEMFRDSGFTIVAEERFVPDNASDLLSQVPIHASFNRYEPRELLPIAGHCVLQKALSPQNQACLSDPKRARSDPASEAAAN